MTNIKSLLKRLKKETQPAYNVKSLIRNLKDETQRSKRTQEYTQLEKVREEFRELFYKIDKQLEKDINQGTYEYVEEREAIHIKITDENNTLKKNFYFPPTDTYLMYTKYTLYKIKHHQYYKELLFYVRNHPNKITHINIVKTIGGQTLSVYIK